MNDTQPKKVYHHSLSRRMMAFSLAFIVLMCTVIAASSYFIFRTRMWEQYQSHITDIMELTLARIDVDDLVECMDTKTPSSTLEDLAAFLDQVRRNCSLEYIVIIRPMRTEAGYDVMAVASGLLEEERNGVDQRTDMSIPQLGDMTGAYYPVDFLPVIYDDMLHRQGIKFSTSHTEYGESFDGAVAIRDSDGEGVALLTAGMTMNFIQSTMRHYRNIMLLATIIIGIAFLAISTMWMQRWVIRPIKRIEEVASDFATRSKGQKDPKALILKDPQIHSDDELEALADTLISMSENMKDYAEELITSATEMEGMRHRISVIRDIALTDALTGVKNKAAYDRIKLRLDEEIHDHTAHFAILMADLNHLKQINDTYGHEKGDIYIKVMCELLCAAFAHSPVFRIGGDEFVVVLEGRDLAACADRLDRL